MKSIPLAAASFLIALLIALCPQSANARTRTVPTDYSSIQLAISLSSQGDTVLVLPGTYRENLVIDAYIVVRSSQGPGFTVIDGSAPSDPDSGSTVWMSTGVIEGFSIANGSGTMVWPTPEVRYGGGVNLDQVNAPPGTPPGIIRNNWIHANRIRSYSGAGAGIFSFGTAQVIGNRVFSNYVETTENGAGAGVCMYCLAEGAASCRIETNEIINNHVSFGTAAGIYTDKAVVIGNIIACNSSNERGVMSGGSALVQGLDIERNTIVANWSTSSFPAVYLGSIDSHVLTFIANNITYNVGPGVSCEVRPPGEVVAECNNIAGNSPVQIIGNCLAIGEHNNVSADPEFGRGACPSTSGDWCLGPDSPLLPANSPPGCGLIGALGECPPIPVPEVELLRPSVLWALPPRPNPFAARTEIPFHLGERSQVEVAIYGVLGREVRTMRAGFLEAGDHELVWDARDGAGRRAAAGAYVAVIRAGRREVTSTLLLLW